MAGDPSGSQFSRDLIQRSGYARAGFAAEYDRYRPRPPRVLLETLMRLAGTERPALVVDVGSGTGLSSRAWAELAERVVGVEPNPSMVEEARAATSAPNVEFAVGYSDATGLDDAAADIVTCSQSLHWMEPAPTFAEAGRILRPGGVFAAYDYDIYPTIEPELDRILWDYGARRGELRRRAGAKAGADTWSKDGHLARLEESREFRYCRELVFHSFEEGDADRVVGLMRSIGILFSDPEVERELRFDEVEAAARRILGDRTVPFLFGYHVRFGIR